MDFFASLNVSVAVTMSMSVSPQYLADLVEYCLGDASTTWGAQRIADGHPSLYQPLAWEIGNEQVRAGRGRGRDIAVREKGSRASARRGLHGCTRRARK